MANSAVALLFIAAAAAGAVGLSQKKTTISGKVMAADLMGQLSKKGITEVTCDDEIPVGVAGATFHCNIAGNDGSTAKIEYKLDRKQGLSGKVIDSSGPTEAHERVPTSSDPWSN